MLRVHQVQSVSLAATAHLDEVDQVNDPPEIEEIDNADAASQTIVTWSAAEVPGFEMTTSHRQSLLVRLTSSAIQPDWAGSDELDLMMSFYRPFMSEAVILPCLSWDPINQVLAYISGVTFDHAFESIIYCIVARELHWFGVKIARHQGVTQCQVHDSVPFDNVEWNGFAQCMERFLQIPLGTLRIQFVPIVAIQGMCGFQALFMILQDVNSPTIPDVTSAILRLQHNHQASTMVHLANHAFDLWNNASTDVGLIRFAFATRVLFLESLVRGNRVETFRLAGGRFPHHHQDDLILQPTIAYGEDGPYRHAHSSLARRFDQYFGRRVGEASHPGQHQADH